MSECWNERCENDFLPLKHIHMKTEFIEAMKARTKRMAVDTIKLYRKLPKTDEGKIVGNHMIRSATSVAANYRASCRGRLQAEFYSKLSITVEECDETILWFEILEEAEIYNSADMQNIKADAIEIVKILSTARKTLSK